MYTDLLYILQMKILLISNSTVYGTAISTTSRMRSATFLGGAARVLFFPFALFDRDGYAEKARTRFAAMGYSLESAHTAADPEKAVEETDAIFIGGGNTFRLLKSLQELGFIEAIRRKVKSGAPYIGSSADRMWPDRRSKRPRTCRSCSRVRLTR